MAVALCLCSNIENDFVTLVDISPFRIYNGKSNNINKLVQMQKDDVDKEKQNIHNEAKTVQEESETKTDTMEQPTLRKRAHEQIPVVEQLSWSKKKRYKEKSSSSASTSTTTSSSESDSESDSTNSDYSDKSESESSDHEKIKANVTKTITTTTTQDNISANISRPNSPVLVPMDPRVWTAEHVDSWVKWITRKFNIVPEPDINRFPTTGDKLCEMSRADFWVCAGSSIGGRLIAQHFAHMLYNSTGRETSPMRNDNEPSECQTNIMPIIIDDEVGQLIIWHINLKLFHSNLVNQCKRLLILS